MDIKTILEFLYGRGWGMVLIFSGLIFLFLNILMGLIVGLVVEKYFGKPWLYFSMICLTIWLVFSMFWLPYLREPFSYNWLKPDEQKIQVLQNIARFGFVSFLWFLVPQIFAFFLRREEKPLLKTQIIFSIMFFLVGLVIYFTGGYFSGASF